MHGLKAYQDVDLNSLALGATGYELTALFIKRAQADIKTAITAIENADIATKCKCLSNAGNIVAHLHGSLNADSDPDFAKRLEATYEHLQQQIFWGNANNDLTALNECAEILNNIAKWWQVVGANM